MASSHDLFQRRVTMIWCASQQRVEPRRNFRRTPLHCPVLRLHSGSGVLHRGQGVTAAVADPEQHASQDTMRRPAQNRLSVRYLGGLRHSVPRSKQSIVSLAGPDKRHHPRILPRLLLLLLPEK